MKRSLTFVSLLLILLLFSGCRELRSTKLQTQPVFPTSIDTTPANKNASDSCAALLGYLAALTMDEEGGVLSGQNCGHGAQIADPNHIMGAARLVDGLEKSTGKAPAIIALDYEHDRCFSSAELSAGNKILIEHWRKGGLVSVGFSALSPWLQDESDILQHPGSWSDTRTTNLSTRQKEEIDLRKLIDPSNRVHRIWRKKLDRIALALNELEDAGVVVLFKPLQEQNGFWFWWGTLSHSEDPEPYIELWRDMFNYLSYEKGLDNLLWIYAPNKNSENHFGIRELDWLYPGDDYVDIVAPTSYNNEARLFDIDVLAKFNKVLAAAELGPDHLGNNGSFDNRIYIESLSNNYPQLAFWISWHDWENGDGTNSYMSIVGNRYAPELMNDGRVLSREDVAWKAYSRK